MSVSEIEATYVSPVEPRIHREPSIQSGYRSQRRPAATIAALSDRIRALQRSEPDVVGDARTSLLAELALIELRVERLALDAWRSKGSDCQTHAGSQALSEQIDRLASHWPPRADQTTLDSLDESAHS